MKSFIILFQLLPFFAWANVQTRVSKIYEIGKLQEPPLFVQTTEIQSEDLGTFTSSAKIEDRDGKVVMTEKVAVRGATLISQFVEQLQSMEAWELVVSENKMVFKTYKITKDGRREDGKKAEEVKSFVNGPLIEMFIAKHWDVLTEGKSVKTAFSVLELQQTVNFTFQKVSDGYRLGKQVMIIKMKPANLFISMLVDPIIIEFDSSTKKMVYFKGRTPLKVLKSGEWKPFDAEILYGHPETKNAF